MNAWSSAPLSAAVDSGIDLSDPATIDIHELARVLRTCDVAIAFTGDDRSQFHELTGSVDALAESTRVAVVHCATACQRLAVAAIVVLQEQSRLDPQRLRQCSEFLTRAAQCPCAFAAEADTDTPVVCLATNVASETVMEKHHHA
jgi:hypothetical protein